MGVDSVMVDQTRSGSYPHQSQRIDSVGGSMKSEGKRINTLVLRLYNLYCPQPGSHPAIMRFPLLTEGLLINLEARRTSSAQTWRIQEPLDYGYKFRYRHKTPGRLYGTRGAGCDAAKMPGNAACNAAGLKERPEFQLTRICMRVRVLGPPSRA